MQEQGITRDRDGTKGVGYRGDEKGLRRQGVYRGRETNHRLGNTILAQSGTCVLGDQRCRPG